MKRHDVSDEEWELLKPLFPVSDAKTGRPARDTREMLNGLMWILKTGAPWRDLPERFGPFPTVYGYFRAWRETGSSRIAQSARRSHKRVRDTGQPSRAKIASWR